MMSIKNYYIKRLFFNKLNAYIYNINLFSQFYYLCAIIV